MLTNKTLTINMNIFNCDFAQKVTLVIYGILQIRLNFWSQLVLLMVFIII